jgi:beta-carotene hydroxylase
VTARIDDDYAFPRRASLRRRGLFRYDADRLSFLWVQVTLLLTLLPWLLPMPLWMLGVVAIPVFYLRSSCGYIHHNQGHLPIFWSKALNIVIDVELALLTGYVTPLWELQHARGHHRHYLTPDKDPASIIDRRSGRPMPRWKYCLFGNLTIIGDSWRIAGEEARHGRADARPRMVFEFVVAGAICVILCAQNWLYFAAFILVPNVLISWFVWHVSYDHHHDVPGTNHYDGSHNHIDAGFNWARFNIGHHAAHHEKPTLHWSLLPHRTTEIMPKLDPSTLHGDLTSDVR